MNKQTTLILGLSPVSLTWGCRLATFCLSTKNLCFLRKYATISIQNANLRSLIYHPAGVIGIDSVYGIYQANYPEFRQWNMLI